MIATLERASSRLAKLAAYVSAVILVYMVAHILLEIFLRVLLARSTYVLDEFVAYSTAAITFLSLAYALGDNALIRVGMLLEKIRGRPRWVLEVFGFSTMLLIVLFVIYYFWTKTFWRDLIQKRESESIAQVPLWIPEIFALVGLLLFALQLLAMLLRLLVTPASEFSTKKE